MDTYSVDTTLTITTQPKQNFHYRYESELTSSHGVVTGQQQLDLHQGQNNTEETFPTIRLRLPANDDGGTKRDFFVLCSLHSYNKEPLSLSPHLLMKKGLTELEYNNIFEQMDENPTDPLERTWLLNNYVIVRLKTEGFLTSLQAKQTHFESLQLPMDFKQFKGNVDVTDKASVKKSGILNVCLGFTIFERDSHTNTYRLYRKTIYSDNIFHGDELKIHELCNAKGSITGNTNVTLLIKLQSGYEYNVHMFRYKINTKEIDWEETIPISSHNVFSNAAITFKLPKGPPDMDSDEIEVMLEVVVGQSTYRSKSVRFQYMNNTEDVVPRKTPRKANVETSASAAFSQTNESSLSIQSLCDEAATGFNLISSDEEYSCIDPYDMHYPVTEIRPTLMMSDEDYNNLMQPLWTNSERADDNISRDKVASENGAEVNFDGVVAQKSMQVVYVYKKPPVGHAKLKDTIAHILRMPKNAKNISIVKVKFGNTIFHEAIMDPCNLLCLYRHMKTTVHKQLVLKARNNFGHNLLHYACTQNRPCSIRPLVGMGCALHEQDLQGRTPLHIAIECHYTECISAIQGLLMDHSKYGADVEDQLIHMFKIYNHRGHTVLHAAVLENLSHLVKVMLEFCKQHKVDILQYEVLGNGDSIAHLMVKHNALDMIQVIKEYVPNYLTIQNYQGQTVLDLPDLSLVTFEALNVK